MKTFNDFKSDLYNMIETAIMNGVSGSTIADALVNKLHINRENALTMVVSVVAQLNLQNNPSRTLTAFDNNQEVVFYGENAEKVASTCNLVPTINSRGIKYLNISRRHTDTVYPKLVKAGYKIAVLDC